MLTLRMDMNNLLIIGAGGCGRDIYNFATECDGFNKEFIVKGFLDDNLNSLKDYSGFPLIVDTIRDYVPQPNDVFICAMGNVPSKKKCVEVILEKGGRFITLIHPSANVAPDARIGTGCIVMQQATIGATAVMDDFVLVQISAIVGHDARVGKYSRLDCLSVMVGGTELKEEVTVHTAAVINHKVVVGKQAQVGACSLVIRNVKQGTTVFGNPARTI